jgi:hypothetical protein
MMFQFMPILKNRKSHLSLIKKSKIISKLSQEEEIRTPLKPSVCKRTSFLVQNAKILDARRDTSLT